ncbi:beta-soluble NSF attachment protein isoform X3 [Phacochoerus africanus]|uniref:beta-soluble NSF attachment protein isoform X3 n=1 Tax=Phacochoerus africanus TaxID=41426 RepID=UPI001FD97743|nr:beta-soluble NSF attachment protein isoform X3 [Phacochoerus africanus]
MEHVSLLHTIIKSKKHESDHDKSETVYFVRTNLSMLFFCTQPAFFGVTSLIRHVQSVLCPGTSWLDVRALLLPVLRIAWLGRLDPWLTLFSLEFLDRCCACVVLPRMLLLKSEAHLVSSVLGNTRIEEACEMYTRAANMFKMAKNWSAAGNAFCQAAKLHMQLQSKHDSATSFVDAGNAYKKADPQEAINCLNAAIDIYTDMGRFTIAAKHHITIAEIYETELVDIEKAIAHYEQSADYYKGEESNSSANKCLLKVAAYAAQLEQYQKAIEVYEQVGASTMDNPLLKYSAKDYFFKAALCHFIVDELNAKLALEKYEEMFPAFTDSRECKLLKVKEFDSISRLDQWLTTMLLRIKKSIPGDGDGDGDLK